MTYPLQLAAIKGIIEGVSNIGTVHDSLRWSRNPAELFQNYVSTINNQSEIRAWFISRSGGADAYGMISGASIGTRIQVPVGQRLRKYNWTVNGFMSFSDDTTEPIWLALVDSMLDAFKNNISLDSTCLERGFLEYEIDHMAFSEVLAHHMQIRFWTAELSGINPT